MQPYKCPTCGAEEPGVHRDTCSLAGEPVWPGYSPPDWSKAEQLLKDNLEVWRQQSPGKIVVINAKTLEYKFFDTDKEAHDRKNPPFGKAPPTGHQLLFQYLMTDQELEADRTRKAALEGLSPAYSAGFFNANKNTSIHGSVFA